MTDTNTKPVVSFPEPEVWGRDWGQEVLLAHVRGKYTLKLLRMKAGTKGGLQAHRAKDETGYIIEGTLLVRFDPGDGTLVEKTLTAGQTICIPPGAVHQEEAVTDCVIVEASTAVFNDRVRMEEKYGLRIDGGMPTTDFPRIE